MKRAWRRWVIILGRSVLVLLLVSIATAAWLYASGRLATVSSNLVQRFSGQDITIGDITFDSWHTAVFTNVRVQAQLPGWQLEAVCTRIEAHIGLLGLLRQQVKHVQLQQPQIVLRATGTTPPPSSAAPAFLPLTKPLPIKRLTIHEGQVAVQWLDTQQTLQHLEVQARRQGTHRLQIDVRGALADTPATLAVTGQADLGSPELTGTAQITIQDVPAALLAALPGILPPAWQVTQGALALDGKVSFTGMHLQGTLRTKVTQMTAHGAGVHVDQGNLTVDATFEGDLAKPALRVNGQLDVQAVHMKPTPDATVDHLALITPFQLTYTPEQWHIKTQQGILQGQWQDNVYSLSALAVHGEAADTSALQIDVRGKVAEGPTTFHVQVKTPARGAEPISSVHVTAQQVPLSLIVTALPSVLPPGWQVTRGMLALDGQVMLHDTGLSGTLTTEMTQVTAQVAGVSVDEARLTVRAVLTGQVAPLTLHADGQVDVQAAHLTPSQDTTLHDMTLSTPFQFTYAPDQWRLSTQQGTLQGQWQQHVYTLSTLEVHVQPTETAALQIDVGGTMAGDRATFHTTIRTSAHADEPTTIHVTAQDVPLPFFVQSLPADLPPGWQITHGTLAVEGRVTLQDERLRGTLTADITRMTAQMADMHISRTNLSATAAFEGRPASHTFTVIGKLRLRAARASYASELTIRSVKLSTPIRLSYTPKQWQLTATLAGEGETATHKGLGNVQHFTLNAPLEMQQDTTGLQMHSTPEITAATVALQPDDPTTVLHITQVRGRFPLRFSAMTLEVTDAELQTNRWFRQERETPAFLSALTLRSAGTFDMQQQQLTVHRLAVTLADLGTVHGSGRWQWSAQALHDVHLQLAPTAVAPLWRRLAFLLPEEMRGWQVTGSTSVTLEAAYLALRRPWQARHLQMAVHVQEGTLETPSYAAEQLHGSLQTTADVDALRGQYMLQGSLTLRPFAFLIGNLFPDLASNHVAPAITFAATYYPQSDQLDMALTGQFGQLGNVSVQGKITQPLLTPYYDLQVRLDDVRAQEIQRTFVYDEGLFPTLASADIQGTLRAHLQVRGQATQTTVQGQIELHHGAFITPTLVLQGLSLSLPVQGQYPLPHTAPDRATVPAAAYGQLAVASMRFGRLNLGTLRTRLALYSDTLLVPDGIHLSLLNGTIDLERINAQHLLQPQRLVMLQTRIHHLDLRQLQRSTDTLPFNGLVQADLLRIQIRGDRLETVGSLDLAFAGGKLQVFDIAGRYLFAPYNTFSCSIKTDQPVSLQQLTRLYSIGEISGTLDLSITNLAVTAGALDAFRLAFAVRERGGEARGITLRALNSLLFTSGSSRVAAGLFGIGDTYRLPYRRFGATATLEADAFRLHGAYHDRKGTEYIMQAPSLGHGVTIIHRDSARTTSFQDLIERLSARLSETPSISIK